MPLVVSLSLSFFFFKIFFFLFFLSFYFRRQRWFLLLLILLFFLLLSWDMLPFFFPWAWGDSALFFCLTRHDFKKKKIWVILFFFFLVLVFHFFSFNWALFFNKGIWINIYKLTFFHPSTFPLPTKQKGKKLKSFLLSHFSTPPTKRTLTSTFCYILSGGLMFLMHFHWFYHNFFFLFNFSLCFSLSLSSFFFFEG